MRLTEQNGRSMVEMLGMLAIAGVLSVGGVMGYKYAVNKNKANRILNDVQLSYININASQNIVLNQLTPIPFTPLSGYPMFTQRVAVQDGLADVIVAQNVEQGVCEHLTDMVQKTQWKLFLTNESATSFTPLTECAENMTLAFSWANMNEIPPVCDKECPENMTCGGNNECICASGYTMGEDSTCQQIVCDYSGGIEAQTQYCCEQAAGIWDATAIPSCTCPEGATFNGTMCLMKDWCSYKFTVPEIVQAVQSDCAFDFTVPETVTADESEVSLTPVSGQTCNTGEYCILNWKNSTCASNVGTYEANTTTRIYGRCAPLDETYNICKAVENGEVSLTPNKECEQKNTYCSILWGNMSCTNVGNYGNNIQRDLYGVCVSYDGSGDTTCPFQ